MTISADVHIGDTASSMSLVGNNDSANTIRDKIIAINHLGSTMLSIDDYAFANCKNLTTVSCEASAHSSYIGSHAFSGCTSLEKCSLFDNGLSTFCIDDYAFSGSGLKDIKLNIVGKDYKDNNEYDRCVMTEKAVGPYLGTSIFEDCT